MSSPLALLLLAYGGPERLEDVGAFLARVMGPSRVTPQILERACTRYRALGGGSPLVANTRAQALALEQRLRQGPEGERWRVFVGMRHSPPYLDEALGQAQDYGEDRALAVIMASHQSALATGGYLRQLAEAEKARAQAGLTPGRITVLDAWHANPLYLEAVAEKARAALAELIAERDLADSADILIIFSAHSLPLPEGRDGDSEYQSALAQTGGGVMARLGPYPWRLAYQSRSPRPGLRWLGPDVEEVLREEAAGGREAVVVVPLGFVVEHLETLYDLDVELKGRAGRLGLAMARAATVQDHPLFIEALAREVEARLEEELGQRTPG